MIRALAREARPKQWAKNVLVFAAPGAAGVLDNGRQFGHTVLAVVAFCLAASGTYFWNDILDVEGDRHHPLKRLRPVASGAVPMTTARVVGSALLAGGVGIGLAVTWKLAVVIAAYVVVTLTYSLWFKHVAVVDLVMVASGFVLRAVAGAVAVDVKMSTWFLLCTSFGSMFIVTGKRYAELREFGDDAVDHRPAMQEYTLGYLRIVLSVSVAATIVTYCQWAFTTKEISGSAWPFYELSIIPMVTAVLRYTLVLEQGHGSAPEEIFLADRTLQALGLLWAVVFGLGVYVG